MIKKETIVVSGEQVQLDPANLRFSETNLTEYIKVEGGWYDSFGAYLAKAEKALQMKEAEHDNLYNLKFYIYKEEGGSDKLAEARAKIDSDVKEARASAIEAKYLVSRIKNHLRAWDKNHDNAQSLGHQLRKELGILHNEIRMPDGMTNSYGQRDAGLYGKFDEVDNIVGHVGDEE